LIDLDYFSVSDPVCTLRIRESNVKHAVWKTSGETEVIQNNLNPKWIKNFRVWIIFIQDMDLHFQVYNYNSHDSRELIGEVEISLSQIMLATGQQMKLSLTLPHNK